MQLVHWPLIGGLVWYSEAGTGRGRSPPRPLFAVPNVATQPKSTASVYVYQSPYCCTMFRCSAVLMFSLTGYHNDCLYVMRFWPCVATLSWMRHCVTMETYRSIPGRPPATPRGCAPVVWRSGYIALKPGVRQRGASVRVTWRYITQMMRCFSAAFSHWLPLAYYAPPICHHGRSLTLFLEVFPNRRCSFGK